MTGNTLQNIEQIDSSVWENAEQSRANSKLATNDEDAMPATGVRWIADANVAWMLPVVHHAAGIGTSRPRGFA